MKIQKLFISGTIFWLLHLYFSSELNVCVWEVKMEKGLKQSVNFMHTSHRMRVFLCFQVFPIDKATWLFSTESREILKKYKIIKSVFFSVVFASNKLNLRPPSKKDLQITCKNLYFTTNRCFAFLLKTQMMQARLRRVAEV